VCLVIENEFGIVAPCGEKAVFESGALDALEVYRRNDLVGIDVAALQRSANAGMCAELVHRQAPVFTSDSMRSAGLARRPATLVATATCGETRCVRPPFPWRPTKFRVEVEEV